MNVSIKLDVLIWSVMIMSYHYKLSVDTKISEVNLSTFINAYVNANELTSEITEHKALH